MQLLRSQRSAGQGKKVGRPGRPQNPELQGGLRTVLLGRKPWALVGGEARVRLAGLVPLRLAQGSAAGRVPRRLLSCGRPGSIGGPGQHPGSLEGHGVVWRFPGWMGVSFGKVRDGDPDVAWRGGRRLSVSALLACCGRDRVPVLVCGRKAHSAHAQSTSEIAETECAGQQQVCDVGRGTDCSVRGNQID